MKVSFMPIAAFFAIVLSFFAACSQSADDVEPGVSLALAEHRAATISNINYDLSFYIPDAVSKPISAVAKIGFDLSDTSRALQLDFRESADKIHLVTVNGEASGFEFRDEHL
ncbi:MAG: hypothetical protein P8M18_10770, partial [Woeseiaceae bacterium]|nr:hypothetical protein [Woeseiaceae bacterium]